MKTEPELRHELEVVQEAAKAMEAMISKKGANPIRLKIFSECQTLILLLRVDTRRYFISITVSNGY